MDINVYKAMLLYQYVHGVMYACKWEEAENYAANYFTHSIHQYFPGIEEIKFQCQWIYSGKMSQIMQIHWRILVYTIPE